MAFVDKEGIYHDHLILKYFAIPSADIHTDHVIRSHYKDDESLLKVK